MVWVYLGMLISSAIGIVIAVIWGQCQKRKMIAEYRKKYKKKRGY